MGSFFKTNTLWCLGSDWILGAFSFVIDKYLESLKHA
jgi:hypothetical protein